MRRSAHTTQDHAQGVSHTSPWSALTDRSLTHTGTSTGTGTWAHSTHSVIWMTNTGKGNHRLLQDRVNWRPAIISCITLAVITVLALANLVDVYGSLGLWAMAAIPAVLIGAAIACITILPSLRIWWQIVFLLIAQFIIGPIICCNNTTIAHVIPSVDTLRDGWFATFGSFKILISITPPIGDAQGSLMAVWTLGLWMSMFTGLFAVLRNKYLSLISVVLELATFALTALLGTNDGWFRAPAGVLTGIAIIAWISWRWQLFEGSRWISSTLIVGIAAAIAFGSCLVIPQHRLVLRDHYDPPLNPYEYASPLSGMRAYIKEHKDDTLLTVQNLPSGTPVRLAVMDRFDGNVWNLSDKRESQDSSNYMRVGTRIANDATGTEFQAQFTVHEGMREDWLPLAGDATSVTFPNEQLKQSFYYNTGTESGLLTNGVYNGLTYSETGIIPTLPSEQQIASADATQIVQPNAEDVPSVIGEFASAVAGGQSNGGEAALALAQALKDRGWFSHGLSSDYPSLPGHGNYRLNKLLAGTAMVGDSEQYASAMALMARELGLPSRVVLGFLPKDEDGEISEARTQTDGKTTSIDFTGNDVTAWVEINLAGYGWVPFYPTPKETKTPDENQNLTPPNPQSLVRQPPVPLTDPLRDEQNTTGQSSIGGDEADEVRHNTHWVRVAQIARKVAIYGSPLWIVLIICGLILAIKAAQIAWLRRHGQPQARVAAGWECAATLARQSGVSVYGTRREQSQQIAQQIHIDPHMLTDAVREADYATFSGAPVDESQANDYWKHIDTIRSTMLASLPRLRRWRTRLSLRGIWKKNPQTRVASSTKQQAVKSKSLDTKEVQ